MEGVFGIIVGGLIYGWIAKQWDSMRRFVRKGSPTGLIYSLGLALLLIGVRSFGDIVMNWYVIAILIVVLRYLGVGRQPRTGSVIWITNENRTSLPV